MTITISPEPETEVCNKARAEGLSVEADVERLLRQGFRFRRGMNCGQTKPRAGQLQTLSITDGRPAPARPWCNVHRASLLQHQ